MATNGSFPQSPEPILFAAFGEGVLDVGQWQKPLFSSGENSLISHFDSTRCMPQCLPGFNFARSFGGRHVCLQHNMTPYRQTSLWILRFPTGWCLSFYILSKTGTPTLFAMLVFGISCSAQCEPQLDLHCFFRWHTWVNIREIFSDQVTDISKECPDIFRCLRSSPKAQVERQQYGLCINTPRQLRVLAFDFKIL